MDLQGLALQRERQRLLGLAECPPSPQRGLGGLGRRVRLGGEDKEHSETITGSLFCILGSFSISPGKCHVTV